eukprot:12217300-Alexandrium_andersonii.AAC.1
MARLPGPGNRYLETFRASAAEAVHLGGAPAASFAGPPAGAPGPAPLAPHPVAPGGGPANDDPNQTAGLVQRVLAA